MEAYWKEWNNFETKEVWRWDSLTEWDAVSSDEKGAEYPKGDPRRKWKYRVVFQGNNVKDQNWNVALFNEMASTPAQHWKLVASPTSN